MNPFRLPLLLLKTKRPSKITDMPIVHDAFWLRKGYDALTFFGTIVTATKEATRQMNGHHDSLKNHEMIHLYQARNTHDSWLCFYTLYIWYYVRALPLNKKRRDAAYLLNPFEMEAYRHMNDTNYLNHPECGQEWRQFARLSPKERLRYHKMPPSSPGITLTSIYS